MVAGLQERISHLGHEKVQSLQGENVCKTRGNSLLNDSFDLVTNVIRGDTARTTYEI